MSAFYGLKWPREHPKPFWNMWGAVCGKALLKGKCIMSLLTENIPGIPPPGLCTIFIIGRLMLPALPNELEAQLRKNLVPPVLYHSDKIEEKRSYQSKFIRKGAWHGMSASSWLISRQGKHLAFFIKHIQIRLGVFISANPNKLFHFSTWQNNQENIVLSVPAAPSTSQSHCS